MGDQADEVQDLINSMRQQCLEKRISGIKGLSALFRGLDKDYSKTITFREFEEGLTRYGIHLDEDKLHLVFKKFDKDNNNVIDFREFLSQLRGPMPQCRINVINEAFDKLDAVRDGVLKVEDLKVTYKANAQQHPKYRSGEWTLDQVLEYFLSTFDCPDDPDGMVTREEFVNYYAGVGSAIDDDMYFELMMRSSWSLPARRQSTK